MKVRKFNIPIYRWSLKTVIAECDGDYKPVIRIVKNFKIPSEYIDEITNQFNSRARNGAILFFNGGNSSMLLVVYPHTDIKELVSTLIHEGRHAADRVIEATGIEGKESVAYLTEYITFNLVKYYIEENSIDN